MKVRALKKTYYAKQDRMPGDVYDMDDREHDAIKVLTLLEIIEVVREEVKQPAPYQTRALAADQSEQSEQPEQQSEAPPPPDPASEPMATEENPLVSTGPRRTYRRRDMRAEK